MDTIIFYIFGQDLQDIQDSYSACGGETKNKFSIYFFFRVLPCLSACPVKCLPNEISVALISSGRSLFNRGGEYFNFLPRIFHRITQNNQTACGG